MGRSLEESGRAHNLFSLLPIWWESLRRIDIWETIWSNVGWQAVKVCRTQDSIFIPQEILGGRISSLAAPGFTQPVILFSVPERVWRCVLGMFQLSGVPLFFLLMFFTIQQNWTKPKHYILLILNQNPIPTSPTMLGIQYITLISILIHFPPITLSMSVNGSIQLFVLLLH